MIGAPRVIVVGAGISGLAAAHRLRELAAERGEHLSIRVLESARRPGGLIVTERDEDGLLLEGGPDQFVTYKPAALALCRRLGLGPELRPIRGDGRPTTGVVHRGRIVPVPPGLAMLAPARPGALLGSPLFSWTGKARIAAERFLPARPPGSGDESLASFIGRRFGREMLERLAEPLFAGIFLADVDSMSAAQALPRLLELERRWGSVTRGMRAAVRQPRREEGPAFVTLAQGLGRLVERLAARTPAGELLADCPVVRVEHGVFDGLWSVRTARGARVEAESLVLACPARASAALLRPLDEGLAAELEPVPWGSCATVHLVYSATAPARPPAVHGFFVPRSSGLPLLACSHVSVKLPERAPTGQLVLRAFLGDTRRPRLLEREDDDLTALAHDALAPLLGLRERPQRSRVHRFPRAMPRYPVGHPATLARIAARLERLPGLFLCGGVGGAVGLPDCTEAGERAAARALEHAVDLARARATAAAGRPA